MALLPEKLPGEQLAIKIVETVANGIGSVANPILQRRARVADARADVKALQIKVRGLELIRSELLAIHRGQKKVGDDLKLIDVFKTDNDKKEHEISELKGELLHYLEQSGINPANFIDVQRQINLLQISAKAIEYSSEDSNQNAKEESVEPDWFTQWRNRAQDISNEEMQHLWAKLLKEETRKKGSFSINTMDLLGRMSREDADLIAKLGMFVLANAVVSNLVDKDEVPEGLNVIELLKLQDLNILNSVGASISWTLSPTDGSRTVKIPNQNLRLLLTLKSNEIRFSVYPLTYIGQELLSLADCKGNEPYLRAIAKSVESQCEKIQLGTFSENKPEGEFIKNIQVLWEEKPPR